MVSRRRRADGVEGRSTPMRRSIPVVRQPAIADYEIDWGEQIRVETVLTVPPLPTCTRCRVCADDACDLESGPFLRAGKVPEWATRAPLPKVDRNAPCSCGSGKKFKKCCGK